MFSNCPYCGFLVALDETGQPLSRCPNCAQRLRDDDASTDAVATATPSPNDAGTTSGTADQSSEPALSLSTPNSVIEPPRGKTDARAAGTRRQPGVALELRPIAVAGETASARPTAPTPAVVPDATPARQDAAPEPDAPQANADSDADATQAAVPARPVSKIRTSGHEAAATPVGASTATDDTTSPQPAPRAARPESAAVAAAADVVPTAADAQRAKPVEPDEARAMLSHPASAAADAEPVPDSSAEAAVSSATADDSVAGGADDSAMATESAATATTQTTTPSPADIPPPVESGASAGPAPPDSDEPAVPARGEDVPMPSATPTAPLPQAADAST